MCPIMCYKNGKVSNLTLLCDGASVWSTWLLKLIHPERQFCESMHESWNIREAEMVLTVHSTQQQVFVTRVILRPSFFMMSSSTIPCRHMLISIACRQTKNNNGRKSQDNTSIPADSFVGTWGMWNVLVCPQRMPGSRTGGDGERMGNWLTQVHLLNQWVHVWSIVLEWHSSFKAISGNRTRVAQVMIHHLTGLLSHDYSPQSLNKHKTKVIQLLQYCTTVTTWLV